MADDSQTGAERAFIADLRVRARALKQQVVSVQDRGARLATELNSKHADWPGANVSAFVQRIFAESR